MYHGVRRTSPVGAGDVIRVGAADYRFGTGPLVLRVIEVYGLLHTGDGWWVDLEGIELHQDGRPVGVDTRPALVRVSALDGKSRAEEG